MKICLKDIAEASVSMLKVVTIYFSVTWFMCVGLASMIVLTGLTPSSPTMQIGAVVGILTLNIPVSLSSWYLLNTWCENVSKRKPKN
jgi:hypothetical protein